MDKKDQLIAKYLPYLREAQKKLLQVMLVFLLGGALGFFYYQSIIKLVMRLFSLEGVNLVLTSPYQFINLAINCGILTGLAAAIPLLGWHLIRFLQPALQSTEHRLLLRLYPISLILFAAGFTFGAWIIQLLIRLYTQVSFDFSVENLWDLSNFLGQILSTGILMALIFQLPIILTGLIRLRAVSLIQLRQSRRYVYLLILVLTALLPPSDIISLIALTIPPLLLFEVTLLFNKDYV